MAFSFIHTESVVRVFSNSIHRLWHWAEHLSEYSLSILFCYMLLHLHHVATLQVPFAGSMQLVCLGRKDRQADFPQWRVSVRGSTKCLLDCFSEKYCGKTWRIQPRPIGSMGIHDVGSTPSSHSFVIFVSMGWSTPGAINLICDTRPLTLSIETHVIVSIDSMFWYVFVILYY